VPLTNLKEPGLSRQQEISLHDKIVVLDSEKKFDSFLFPIICDSSVSIVEYRSHLDSANAFGLVIDHSVEDPAIEEHAFTDLYAPEPHDYDVESRDLDSMGDSSSIALPYQFP